MIKVVSIQGKKLMRTALDKIIDDAEDVELLAQAANGEDGIKLTRERKPDIVITDIIISKGITGIEVIRRLQMTQPDTKILVLAGHNNSIFATHAIKAGANAYLTQRCTPDELLNSLRDVMKDNVKAPSFSLDIAQKMGLEQFRLEQGESPIASLNVGKKAAQANLLLTLSIREIEILCQLMLNCTVEEIAKNLFITCKTVNTYRYTLFSKLNVGNNVQMLWAALNYGLEEFF